MVFSTLPVKAPIHKSQSGLKFDLAVTHQASLAPHSRFQSKPHSPPKSSRVEDGITMRPTLNAHSDNKKANETRALTTRWISVNLFTTASQAMKRSQTWICNISNLLYKSDNDSHLFPLTPDLTVCCRQLMADANIRRQNTLWLNRTWKTQLKRW